MCGIRASGINVMEYFKVPMKRKLFLGSYKIYPFKHSISKFEIAGVKISDFVSAQSWAILASKMVLESRGQNATTQYPLTSCWCQGLQFIMAEEKKEYLFIVAA